MRSRAKGLLHELVVKPGEDQRDDIGVDENLHQPSGKACPGNGPGLEIDEMREPAHESGREVRQEGDEQGAQRVDYPHGAGGRQREFLGLKMHGNVIY